MESAGKRRLRVLFLSQRFLYPMDTGGKIRTGKLLEKLKDLFEITLISNVDARNDLPHLTRMRTLCSDFIAVPWRDAPKRSPRFYLRALGGVCSRYPITVLNDYSRELEAAVLRALERRHYDVLVCDFLQSALNFARVAGSPTLLFQHNVESVLAQRYFASARGPVAKAFWRSQLAKMERFEREACQGFTGVVTVSAVDKAILEERFGARNVFAIPTGVDTQYFAPETAELKEHSLVFAGSMDWLPNEDAVLFFADEILGRITQHLPSVKLTVVGRNPSRALLRRMRRHPEIDVVGAVDDIRPFIRRNAVYVIPLRIGSGTRIKVYEAMSMGKAIVSTSVGVEGLPVTTGRHLVIADRPTEFAAAVVELLRDHEARRELEVAARGFVERNFSWERAAIAFADACRKVAATTPPVREDRAHVWAATERV
jgi:polysaccharide biosynthesis protein PslH